MKTITIRIFATATFIALTSFLYTGCKKEEDPKPQNASSAADNANAESVSRYVGYADIDFRCYCKSIEELNSFETLFNS